MTTTPTRPSDVRTTFVHLGYGVPGVLYEPEETSTNSQIGVFVMHASGDYTTFSAGPELARRGYRVLCANNSTSKTMMFDDGVLDAVLLQIKAGVEFLGAYPGVRKTVLLGHSGGATLMTAYQMIAERGIAGGRGPEKIHQCPDDLASLVAADAVVLPDANWGQSTMALFSTDPAVVDESSGMHLDPSLDMYNPDNGFVRGGSTYSADFVATFLAAEGARNNAILARAQHRLSLIEDGKGMFADDEPFFVPGATFLGPNNKLYSQDTRLLSRSVRPWPLVHADGSSTTQIITTIRKAMDTQNQTRSMRMGALKTTVRNYLSSYAIRVGTDYGYGEDSRIHGVDWLSNYSNPPGNVTGISVPLLVLGMTGGWEGLAAETIHDQAGSTDKTLAFIEGATHMFTPRTDCEETPGQFGDTVKSTYDQIDIWLSTSGRLL